MFENIDWVMLIGQGLGVVAVILGFITYQMKSPKVLLIINLITCGVFCLHEPPGGWLGVRRSGSTPGGHSP